MVPHLDKWVHGVVYGVFSILLLIGWKRYKSALELNHYYPAILLATSYGIVMETLQFFSKERSFEWLDIAANAMGALLGALLYYGVCKFINSPFRTY